MQFICGDHWEYQSFEKGNPDWEGCPWCHIEELETKISLAQEAINSGDIKKASEILEENNGNTWIYAKDEWTA